MRNMAKSTRRATAVTLAAALAVACYLNWQYARTDMDTVAVETAAAATSAASSGSSDTSSSGSGQVTDALLTEAEAASAANKNYGEAQLVSVANDTGSQFFDEARLKREKAHDEALDTIQKTLKDSSLSDAEKAEYTAQMTANAHAKMIMSVFLEIFVIYAASRSIKNLAFPFFQNGRHIVCRFLRTFDAELPRVLYHITVIFFLLLLREIVHIELEH